MLAFKGSSFSSRDRQLLICVSARWCWVAQITNARPQQPLARSCQALLTRHTAVSTAEQRRKTICAAAQRRRARACVCASQPPNTQP